MSLTPKPSDGNADAVAPHAAFSAWNAADATWRVTHVARAGAIAATLGEAAWSDWLAARIAHSTRDGRPCSPADVAPGAMAQLRAEWLSELDPPPERPDPPPPRKSDVPNLRFAVEISSLDDTTCHVHPAILDAITPAVRHVAWLLRDYCFGNGPAECPACPDCESYTQDDSELQAVTISPRTLAALQYGGLIVEPWCAPISRAAHGALKPIGKPDAAAFFYVCTYHRSDPDLAGRVLAQLLGPDKNEACVTVALTTQVTATGVPRI